MMKMKAIDIFSGAGGSTEAMKKHFDIIAAVEFDPVTAKSYELNHGKEHLFVEDVMNLSNEFWSKLTEGINLDLLVSTPPCQGFSKYTRTKVIESNDERNQLILETLRIARVTKPNFVFMENVTNIINYKVFHTFIKKLANIKLDGTPQNALFPSYHIRFECVSSSDYDVPQKRNRMILIAKKIDVFPEKDAYVRIRNTPAPIIKNPLKIWPKKKRSVLLGEYLKGFGLTALKAGEVCEKDALHRARNLSEINLRRIKATRANGGSRNEWNDDLVLECHRKAKVGFTDVYGRMSFEEYAPTITCGCITYSKGRFGHPIEDRAISLREAALIQTFPYEYKFTGKLSGEVYEGSMDKIATQIGNAIPINMISLFLDSIYEDLISFKYSQSSLNTPVNGLV